MDILCRRTTNLSTKIIMIRHGYSISNNLKFFTGQSDIELTDIGREQARLCGDFLKGYKGIDAIYSSDLSRAYDTALAVGRALSLDVKKDAELREIYAGEWEMMPFVEIEEKYPAEYGVWKNDIGRATPVLGDSVLSMAKRIEGAVRRIASEHDGGCVVIVTHATPIRAICTLAEGLELSEMGRVSWVSNASISVFEFDGNFRAVDRNITSHLGSLKTDLPRGLTDEDEAAVASVSGDVIRVSCETEDGIADLASAVAKIFGSDKLDLRHDAVIWDVRQRTQLMRADAVLDSAVAGLTYGDPLDAVCTTVEEAMAALSETDGRGVNEEIVNEIFARFCVGK
jgi:broad specificity phosphatase PhoE